MSRVRRSLISALNPASGEAVVIRGWVHRLRVLAKTTFIIVKDCTGEAQCVATTESIRDLRLKLDDAVEIHGVARADLRAKAGLEIDVSGVVILNEAGNQLPFNSSSDRSNLSAEIRTEYRPLALRKWPTSVDAVTIAGKGPDLGLWRLREASQTNGFGRRSRS